MSDDSNCSISAGKKCLDKLSELISLEVSGDEIYGIMAEIISSVFREPENTGAVISVGDEVWHSSSYDSSKECPVFLKRNLELSGISYGYINVVYYGSSYSGDEYFTDADELFLDAVSCRILIICLKDSSRAELNRCNADAGAYRQILNNSPVIAFLWETGEGWPVRFVSDNVSVLGYSPDDFYSGKILYADLIHPDDLKRVEDEISGHLSAGADDYSQEYRVFNRDGELRNIYDRTIVRRDEEGSPVLFEGIIIDITERVVTEEELKLANEKYSTVFSLNPDVIILSTLDEGVVLEVNDRWESFSGIQRDDVIGRKILDLNFYLCHEDRERYVRELEESGSVLNFELDLNIQDMVRTVFMSGRIIELEDAKCLITIIHDMTGQKIIEEKLKESEEKFRAVSETATDAICIMDDSGAVVFWNKAAGEMFGYSSGDVSGRNFVDVFVPEGGNIGAGDGLYPYINKIFESELLTRDSVRVPVEISSSVLESGGEKFIVSIIRDISERKKYEDELKDAAIKIRTVFDSIGDAMYVIDRDYSIVDVNKGIYDAFGFKPEDLTGRKCYSVFHGADKPCELCAAGGVFKTGTSGRVEKSVINPDGSVAYYDTFGSPITDLSGNVIQAVISARNITDMNNYRSSLEEANKKLNLLSGITRHDILNSITIATGYLGLMKENIPAEDRDYASKLEISIKNIQRQIEFTRDYQDMGVKPPEWQVIEPIILECLSEGGGVPSGVHVTLEIKPVVVYADVMLRKAFCNIITNAYKHAFGMKNLSVISGNENGNLLIRIYDDGSGVPEDKKESIFRPAFGRKHGYGLFLVREILSITGITIKEMGGEGEGACFEITVPSGKWQSV
ncbi:PAS domain-containing protein [Methanoplanus limicola]|uniref:histidine kinase n=1 Tax=Methanoplanus limicola DSM 2279 TaxID=937775 RepID=H1YYS2_9EURY|nr:PAS domain S-box protein [Methanoplanus limicola]EHQ36994.1 PAS/PAC sensor signal transduction histidine kinase [Methanoplanus limicola DSM 2279]